MHTIGRINKSIYSCITEDIVTDEVIITDNQLQHILDRHPEVYKEVTDYLNDIISAPDFIIKDNNTIHCIKNGTGQQRYSVCIPRMEKRP